MADDLLTYAEAAELLHVSLSTIIRWTRPGKAGEAPVLRAHKLGPRIVRIKRSDALAIVKPRQDTPTGEVAP